MGQAKPKIFISHAWEDKPLVQRLENALRAAGAEVWVDHADLRGGQNLPRRISDALAWCSTLLLVWSEAARHSEWVELEWTCALSLGKIIIPCKRGKTPLPAILTSRLFLDFGDPEKGLAELLRALDLAEAPAAKAESPQTEPVLSLRATPKQTLTEGDVKVMLKKYNFFCGGELSWSNPTGQGVKHAFELRQSGTVVYDAATGLTWQQAGSDKYMPHDDAQKYIDTLNRERFACYDDWRLPTLEEAMSLMAPEENSNGLYIDAIFDQMQRYIWTADKTSSGAWDVVFKGGFCDGYGLIGYYYYVRAVR